MGSQGGRFVASAVVGLLGIDQLSKLWVQSNLPLYSTIEVVPTIFRLSYHVNKGAVGGIGWHSPFTIPVLVGASLLLVVLLFVLYRYYARLARPSWRIKLFLALAVAPLLSHTLDRLRQGYVVDFLHFTGLPVFNFADLLPHLAVIVLGLEIADSLRLRRRMLARNKPTNTA